MAALSSPSPMTMSTSCPCMGDVCKTVRIGVREAHHKKARSSNAWCLQHSVVQKYLSFNHIVRIFSLQFLRQLNDPVRYREMKGFGKKSGFSKEQEATFRLEEFLKRRYEFRFNTVLDEDRKSVV